MAVKVMTYFSRLMTIMMMPHHQFHGCEMMTCLSRLMTIMMMTYHQFHSCEGDDLLLQTHEYHDTDLPSIPWL
jgi:hypothetical protein